MNVPRLTGRPVIALGRHAGTEVAGLGASPGTHLFFSSLEQSLRRDCTLVRVPPYYYSMDAQRSVAIAYDILSDADACIFGLPPHPVDLDAFFLVRAHLRKHVPFVYLPLGEFPRGAWTYRHIHQRISPRDLVVFSSNADKAVYDALVETAPVRSVVIPFGIRAEYFRDARETRETTRRQLGLAPDAVVFVSHGRIIPEKNVHGTIMLFRRVANEHPTTQLWIIGALPDESGRGPGPRRVSQLADSPISRIFRRLLCHTPLEHRVLFWGGASKQALPQLLGAADIGVNLTLYEDENFGYSTIEAMACGLPVIGTDWGGLKDTIAHAETGFLVPTVITATGIGFDHWAAWRYASALVGSEAQRRRMGAAARRRVARHFTLARFSHALMNEIVALFEPADELSVTEHRWSALGKRLVRRYTTDRAGKHGGIAATPIPLMPRKFILHPLIRQVLLPYATAAQSPAPARDAMFFLTTELMELRGTHLRSTDPGYTLSSMISDRLDRAVIRLLQRHGFCPHDCLIRATAPMADPATLRASLARLLRAGIILQSTAASTGRVRRAAPPDRPPAPPRRHVSVDRRPRNSRGS
jgi:glycosyltransferase involved in cell wall biosynthesis